MTAVRRRGPLRDALAALPTDECVLWGGRINNKGYGLAWSPTSNGAAAHRVVYERLIGPIAAGLQLDHLCRNRDCVNPAHMEPVSPSENYRRARLAKQSA